MGRAERRALARRNGGGAGFAMMVDPDLHIIRIQYTRSVRWIGFSLQEAVAFRGLLDKHILELQRKGAG